MMKKLFALIVSTLISLNVAAADLSYDLGGSSSTSGNNTYSEINLGLNWYVYEWLNWRNAIFTRFGSDIDSVTGLDSSLRFTYTTETDGGGMGFQAFAGPGVRIANASNTGILGEAGVLFRLGGLVLGGGARAIHYAEDRIDSRNRLWPRDETQYFIILGGGGRL